MQLVIATDGTIRTLYTEDVDLASLGEAVITRASHVEPAEGAWWADLSPVAGPLLGPFDRRSEALAAEAEWLEANRLTGA